MAQVLDANDNVLRPNQVTENVVYSLDGNDTVISSQSAPQLYGGLGNDFLGNAGNGEGYLEGGAGNDTLHGGTVRDQLYGGSDTDLLIGGEFDYAAAGSGTIILYETEVGSGDDYLEGGSGTDSLWGLDGSDALYGGDGNDTYASTVNVPADPNTEVGSYTVTGGLYGGGGDDFLYGGAGDDSLQGGTGADYLDGGSGLDYADYRDSAEAVVVNLLTQSASGGDAQGDTLVSIENAVGSSSNDSFVSGAAANVIDGGDGTDTVDYSASAAGVSVSLINATGTGGNAQGDSLTKIENLTGSGHRDTLTGENGVNILLGGAGNDTLKGAGGADTLNGGTGLDTVTYEGFGAITADLRTFSVTGGAATGDTLLSIEKVVGSWDSDTFIMSSAVDRADGNDVINFPNTTPDNDTVDYSKSTAAVSVNLRTGSASGGYAEGDIIANFESAAGSASGDTLTGDAGANTLSGNAGNDKLYGKEGSDALLGGDGDDALSGFTEIDRLDGGYGNDDLSGGEGVDTFVFANTLNATKNVDTISDFSHVDDTMELAMSKFIGLAAGTLEDFRLKEISGATSTKGVDSTDRILYDKAHGDFYFDRDGSKTDYARILFAHVADNTSVDNTDFLVV
jgi:Ca2+-binding RTX toxin-like protein